jgi:hypothetical protein
MTALQLMYVYRYSSGTWEAREPGRIGDYTFELWNGSHKDAVTMRGFEDGGNREVSILVKDDQFSDTIVDETSRFSAAHKWGYAHAVLYGDPTTPSDPYVVVLEIAEDASEEDEHVSPHPYMVIANLAFTEHVAFADSLPDLVGLMGELQPLLGQAKPRKINLYDLHKWSVNSGWR